MPHFCESLVKELLPRGYVTDSGGHCKLLVRDGRGYFCCSGYGCRVGRCRRSTGTTGYQQRQNKQNKRHDPSIKYSLAHLSLNYHEFSPLVSKMDRNVRRSSVTMKCISERAWHDLHIIIYIHVPGGLTVGVTCLWVGLDNVHKPV
jgi:hypothetical protein